METPLLADRREDPSPRPYSERYHRERAEFRHVVLEARNKQRNFLCFAWFFLVARCPCSRQLLEIGAIDGLRVLVGWLARCQSDEACGKNGGGEERPEPQPFCVEYHESVSQIGQIEVREQHPLLSPSPSLTHIVASVAILHHKVEPQMSLRSVELQIVCFT